MSLPLPMKRAMAPALLALACLPAAPAQNAPLLRVQPTAKPGDLLHTFLFSRPAQAFATLVDTTGGPTLVLGETMHLGLSPALVVLDSGFLDPIGLRRLVLQTPSVPALAGRPLFAQSIVLDASAPNRVFRASNGESAVLHAAAGAIAFRFDDAEQEGWTGEFDRSVRDRLQGLPNRERLATVADLGTPFGQPIATPLAPFGSRAQMVYRVADLGTAGVEEHVTEVQWRPLGRVQADTFPRIVLSLAHSHVVPDYSVDPFSALPRFPNSGLSTTFVQNYKGQPQVIYDGPYAIDPAKVRPDGFLPYPAITPFAWNGIDSLLVELQVPPSNASGVNGATIDIMVQSSPQPNARAYATGTAAAPIDPFNVQSGRGDNSLHHVQLRLERVSSVALSPWTAAPPFTSGVYRVPYVVGTIPPGTDVTVELRGARDANGTNATGWDLQLARGMPFVQVRVTLRGRPGSQVVPSVDTLVVPVD